MAKLKGNAQDRALQLAQKIRAELEKQAIRDENHAKELLSEMKSHEIPTKNQSRIAAKVTKGTRNSFNVEALKGVPGGHWTKMVLAKETGTRTMSHERSRELTPAMSRQHCYTTKSAVHSFGA